VAQIALQWAERRIELPSGVRRLRRDVPADQITTLGGGGRVGWVAEVAAAEDLVAISRHLQEAGVPHVVLGEGSNVLVSDNGFPGVVLRYVSAHPEVVREVGDLEVAASSRLDGVARLAVELGLAGLEFASGLPGTVGGAVWGNAGAFGGDMGRVAHRVQVLLPQGEVEWWGQERVGFAYRETALGRTAAVILRVRLRLQEGDRGVLRRERERILHERGQRFPDWRRERNAGCFFRNPPGLSAGVLIEKAGLKGERRGGAMVSPRHAAVIVRAQERGSAREVVELALRVAERVEKYCGICLLPEVRFLGDFGDLLPPSWKTWSRVPVLGTAGNGRGAVGMR